MANFTVGDIGQVQNPHQATQPVTDKSPLVALSGVQDLLTTGLGIHQANQEREAETQEANSLQSFRSRSLDIADAVDQGSISSQMARREMRALHREFSSHNPLMAPQLREVHNEITSTHGMGKVIADGTEQEQAYLALEATAIQAGYVQYDASSEMRAMQLQNYVNNEHYKQQIAMASSELALESQEVSLSTARDSLRATQAKRQQQEAAAGLNMTQTSNFRMQTSELMNLVSEGEISREDALLQLSDLHAFARENITAIAPDLGGAAIDNMMRSFEMVHDNVERVLSEELSQELGNRQLDMLEQSIALDFMRDPELARVVTISNLFPNSMAVQTWLETSTAVSQLLRQNGMTEGRAANPTGDAEEREVWQGYVDTFITPNLDLFLRDQLDGEASEELHTHMESIIRSIPQYGDSTQDITEFSEIVDFMTSNRFGAYVEKQGGVPVGASDQAMRVMEYNYERTVKNLLQQAYVDRTINVLRDSDSSMRVTREEALVSDVIRPRFVGGGVVFELNEEVLGESPGGAARRVVRQLNEEASPQLNKLIRMSAHFNGTRNYGQIYEKHYRDLFSMPQTEEPEQNEE